MSEQNDLNPSALAAAISITDADVPVPSRARPDSLTSQIRALEVGGIAIKGAKLDAAMTLGEQAAQLASINDKIYKSISSSVRHAKAVTGGTYTVEMSDFFTRSRALVVAAVITRVE